MASATRVPITTRPFVSADGVHGFARTSDRSDPTIYSALAAPVRPGGLTAGRPNLSTSRPDGHFGIYRSRPRAVVTLSRVISSSDAGHLVGKRHCSKLRRLALKSSNQPARPICGRPPWHKSFVRFGSDRLRPYVRLLVRLVRPLAKMASATRVPINHATFVSADGSHGFARTRSIGSYHLLCSCKLRFGRWLTRRSAESLNYAATGHFGIYTGLEPARCRALVNQRQRPSLCCCGAANQNARVALEL